jgi:hypothetical protein
MQKLLQLIEKLYGKTALSKTLGTRTNVITLSDNETKRFIKDELNIEAASDAAALAAKNRAEKLIADIPKMNDQEILTFTNNLQRLDNKLNPPKAEMFDITTKKPISKEGIAQLETDFGLPEGVDEGSIMGNLTRAAQRVREQAKTVPGIQEGEKLQTGVMRSAVRYKMLDDLEKGILKVSEEEAAIIKGEAKGDPLDLWLENYGPDAMEAIQEMEPALRRGTTPKDLLLTIEKNVDARPLTEAEKLEMKANTREAGRVMQEYKDRVKGVSKEELKQKDPEMYDLLYGEGDPEEFAKGGRVGLKGGGDVPIITLDDKIDEMISFYQDYLKKGGKMDFLTFSREYIPENFAKGGRVGYQDGGPTKDEYGIMSLPSVPSNPDSVNDDIDRVAQLVAQSYKMSPEAQMNNKQIAYDRIEEIAEQISYGGNIAGVRSNLIDYFNDKVQEYQSMIQEFSTGGRVGYAYGSGKKLLAVLKDLGKDLKTEIKKSVDDLIPTGDPKLDADMALDNMLEELGIDRDAIDGYDILDAYGLAYDEIKKPLLQKLKNKPGSKPIKKGDPITSENFGESQFAPDTSDLEKAKELAPKMTERFELKQKYPGIDDKLLTQIIDDPDPQRKAEVLATLDQAFELMRRGKSPDEILSILKNITDRTKQASGGLSYLSGF